jgi:hypothetical protein
MAYYVAFLGHRLGIVLEILGSIRTVEALCSREFLHISLRR